MKNKEAFNNKNIVSNLKHNVQMCNVPNVIHTNEAELNTFLNRYIFIANQVNFLFCELSTISRVN